MTDNSKKTKIQNSNRLDKSSLKKKLKGNKSEDLFWKKQKIIMVRDIIEDQWVFDGPPYANGMPHYGHYLNKALKNFILKGQKLLEKDPLNFTHGFDIHGRGTELKVLKNNLYQDQKISFIDKCLKFSATNIKIWQDCLKNWNFKTKLNLCYSTNSLNFVFKTWSSFKKLSEEKKILKDFKIVNWCISCLTTISNNETKTSNDSTKDSYLVLFELIERPLLEDSLDLKKIYLVVFTTTAWNLQFNVNLAVNSNIDYLLVVFRDLSLILSKNGWNKWQKQILEKINLRPLVISDFKIALIIAKQYRPLEVSLKNQKDLEKGQDLKLWTISEESVAVKDQWTGILHLASNFSKIDNELVLSKNGSFFKINFTITEALILKWQSDVEPLIFLKLKDHGSTSSCQRCGSKVIEVTREEYFLEITDQIRQRALNSLENTLVVPYFRKLQIKKWIENFKKWSISRDRLFGIALPVWQCSLCKNEEIKTQELKDLIRSFRDCYPDRLKKIIFKCNRCQNNSYWIGKTQDIWIDSGSLFVNFKIKKIETLIESHDMCQNWFSSLLLYGSSLNYRWPVKRIFCYGHIIKEPGIKLSKSSGDKIDSSLTKLRNLQISLISNCLKDQKMPSQEQLEKINRKVRIIKNLEKYLKKEIEFSKKLKLTSDTNFKDLLKSAILLEDIIVGSLKNFKLNLKEIIFNPQMSQRVLLDLVLNVISRNFIKFYKNLINIKNNLRVIFRPLFRELLKITAFISQSRELTSLDNNFSSLLARVFRNPNISKILKNKALFKFFKENNLVKPLKLENESFKEDLKSLILLNKNLKFLIDWQTSINKIKSQTKINKLQPLARILVSKNFTRGPIIDLLIKNIFMVEQIIVIDSYNSSKLKTFKILKINNNQTRFKEFLKEIVRDNLDFDSIKRTKIFSNLIAKDQKLLLKIKELVLDCQQLSIR